MICLVCNDRDIAGFVDLAYTLNCTDSGGGVSYDNVILHLRSSLSFFKDDCLVRTALYAGRLAVVVLHTKVALLDNL